MTRRTQVDGTTVLVATDGRAFAELAATELARAIDAALARNDGLADAALSGGRTPEPVFEQLARLHRAEGQRWAGLTLWLADERCVPPEHPDSNGALVARTLALPDAHGAPGPVLERPEDADEDPEAAAADYASRYPERLDLLVLGLGEDGHTASLFPGSAALGEDGRAVVVVGDGPPPHRTRLTVTPPVIAAAHDVVMLVRGRSKAAAVAAALSPDSRPEEVPGCLARRALWVLDEEAASRLGDGS